MKTFYTWHDMRVGGSWWNMLYIITNTYCTHIIIIIIVCIVYMYTKPIPSGVFTIFIYIYVHDTYRRTLRGRGPKVWCTKHFVKTEKQSVRRAYDIGKRVVLDNSWYTIW